MFTAVDLLENRFTFLHVTHQVGEDIDWDRPECSLLWKFNQHYFEYLHALTPLLDQHDATTETATRRIADWLEDWIENNPVPCFPGWHSYPLSLRTIHWIQLLWNHPQFRTTQVTRSLYLQLLHLEGNLEKHLLANHLLENYRALLFGGLFFSGSDADRWRMIGLAGLYQQIVEQILPDGGHFEGSPMYHCLVLHGLLDTVAILDASGEESAWLSEPVLQMTSWIDRLKGPDGSFPLFNDAAFGIAPDPLELVRESSHLAGYRPANSTLQQVAIPPLKHGGESSITAHSSGICLDSIYRLEAGDLFCWMDGSAMSPSYNPGHSHADLFSYELLYRSKRVIVDPGTFHYENDSHRDYFRTTRFHNTLFINDLEQAEVWKSFRVGRRSNPTYCVSCVSNGVQIVRGAYRNQVRPQQKLVHERLLCLFPDNIFLVWDRVTGCGNLKVNSHLHFAPGWTVESTDSGLICHSPELPDLNLGVLGVDVKQLGSGFYAPEFGREIKVTTCDLQVSGDRELQLGYLFTPRADLSFDSVVFDSPNNRLQVTLAGQDHILNLPFKQF
jgi:uncharacterized heparinase superfamily protein